MGDARPAAVQTTSAPEASLPPCPPPGRQADGGAIALEDPQAVEAAPYAGCMAISLTGIPAPKAPKAPVARPTYPPPAADSVPVTP